MNSDGLRIYSKKKKKLLLKILSEINRLERRHITREESLGFCAKQCKNNHLKKYYKIDKLVDMPTKNLPGVISQLKQL